MTKSTIFISYSPENNQEKNHLLTHLNVLKSAGLVDLWSDDEISAGANWKEERFKAINRADIAILLISANYLKAEEFVFDEEIPEILKRHDRGELVIIPIIAKACTWEVIEWLKEMQVRPSNHLPIWGNSTKDIDQELTIITDEIVQIITSAPDEAEVMGRSEAEKIVVNLTEQVRDKIIYAAAALNNITFAIENMGDNWGELPSQLEQARTSETKDTIIIRMASTTRANTHIIAGEWPFFASSLSTAITSFTVSVNLLNKFNISDRQSVNAVIGRVEAIKEVEVRVRQMDNRIRNVSNAVSGFPDEPPILEDAKKYLIDVLENSRNDISNILDRIPELEREKEVLVNTSSYR